MTTTSRAFLLGALALVVLGIAITVYALTSAGGTKCDAARSCLPISSVPTGQSQVVSQKVITCVLTAKPDTKSEGAVYYANTITAAVCADELDGGFH